MFDRDKQQELIAAATVALVNLTKQKEKEFAPQVIYSQVIRERNISLANFMEEQKIDDTKMVNKERFRDYYLETHPENKERYDEICKFEKLYNFIKNQQLFDKETADFLKEKLSLLEVHAGKNADNVKEMDSLGSADLDFLQRYKDKLSKITGVSQEYKDITQHVLPSVPAAKIKLR